MFFSLSLQGFFPAMFKCRCIVTVFSFHALANLKNLNTRSAVDPFILELRAALQMRRLQFCDYIIPVAVGQKSRNQLNSQMDNRNHVFTTSYDPWAFDSKEFSNDYVMSLDRKVRELFFGQGITEGLRSRQRVRDTVSEIISQECPPFFVEKVFFMEHISFCFLFLFYLFLSLCLLLCSFCTF